LKKKIIINKNSNLAYIPADMIKSGYIGEVEAIANAVTVVLIKPHTDLESVKRSLEITIQDIELRISQGETK
jgi:hypothetical protein